MQSRNIFSIAVLFTTICTQQMVFAIHAPSVDFFLTPESKIPSGQANSKLLAQNKLKTLDQDKVLLNLNDKKLETSAENLAKDIHVSKWVLPKINDLELKESAAESAKTLKVLTTSHHLKILAFEKIWAKVEAKPLVGYVKIQDLISNYHDTGRFFSLVDTYLRIKPSYKSNLHTTIPKQTLLEPLSEDTHWIEVKYQGIRGFVDKNHLLSKLNFAIEIEKNKKWIKYKNEKNLKEFSGIKTDSTQAIVIEPTSQLVLRNQVKIVGMRSGRWTQSLLKSHGLVWWQEPLINSSELSKKENSLNIDQLLKREIFSIGFHPENKKIALASSKGIYFTENGVEWRKLTQFEDQNLPVFIHSDGSWFIGPYRSTNNGQSFSEYLPAQKIAQLLEASKKSQPKYVKMLKLTSVSSEKIEMLLDTGFEKVTLVSRNRGQGWVVQ